MKKQLVGIMVIVALVIWGCSVVNARAERVPAQIFFAQTGGEGGALWEHLNTAIIFQCTAVRACLGYGTYEARELMREMLAFSNTNLIGKGVKVLVTKYVENPYLPGAYGVYYVVVAGYSGWMVSGHLEEIR